MVKIKSEVAAEAVEQVDLNINPTILHGGKKFPFELAGRASVKTVYCQTCKAYHIGNGFSFSSAEHKLTAEALKEYKYDFPLTFAMEIERNNAVEEILKFKAFLTEIGWEQ